MDNMDDPLDPYHGYSSDNDGPSPDELYSRYQQECARKRIEPFPFPSWLEGLMLLHAQVEQLDSEIDTPDQLD